MTSTRSTPCGYLGQNRNLGGKRSGARGGRWRWKGEQTWVPSINELKILQNPNPSLISLARDQWLGGNSRNFVAIPSSPDAIVATNNFQFLTHFLQSSPPRLWRSFRLISQDITENSTASLLPEKRRSGIAGRRSANHGGSQHARRRSEEGTIRTFGRQSEWT